MSHTWQVAITVILGSAFASSPLRISAEQHPLHQTTCRSYTPVVYKMSNMNSSEMTMASVSTQGSTQVRASGTITVKEMRDILVEYSPLLLDMDMKAAIDKQVSLCKKLFLDVIHHTPRLNQSILDQAYKTTAMCYQTTKDVPRRLMAMWKRITNLERNVKDIEQTGAL